MTEKDLGIQNNTCNITYVLKKSNPVCFHMYIGMEKPAKRSQAYMLVSVGGVGGRYEGWLLFTLFLCCLKCFMRIYFSIVCKKYMYPKLFLFGLYLFTL